MWRGCLVETLDEHWPGHGIDPEELRPFLRDGFPWDSPASRTPSSVRPGGPTSRCCSPPPSGAGIDPPTPRSSRSCPCAATSTRARVWELFPDTRLRCSERLLREDGWRHVVLSNHVPELPEIAEVGLGLSGARRPHRQFLGGDRIREASPGRPCRVLHSSSAGTRRRSGWSATTLADVAGAEAVGIPAVLVRTQASPSAG